MMQPRRFCFVLLVFFCGLFSVRGALGDPIAISNTGSSGGVALPVGQTDPNYSLISAPTGVPLTAITTNPNPAWTPNTATADWISPGSSGGTAWPTGTYDFQTTFSLTGDDPSTAELSGMWATDNSGCIFLNSVNTGDCTGNASFGSLTAFSITSGFVAGVNTLDFMVLNSAPSPVGVIAEVSGTVSSGNPTPAVPEPSSLVLAATGLLGLYGRISRSLARRA
jgi:hypothetical protein